MPTELIAVHIYPGADGAFDNPDFAMHDAGASVLAWQRTAAFLGEHLPPR